MTRKRVIAAGVAALFALALAAYAVAARQAATVASYTGCLKNGKLESVAVGEAPLAPCGTGQTQVRLGGGDVTAVVAGTGLSGGGDQGAVTLAADTAVLQARVAGTCLGGRSNPADASISAIHADGSVLCNPDDAGAGTEVVAGFADGPGSLPSGATPQPLAKLPLPQGRYAISATIGISPGATLGGVFVRCELRAGGDFDRAELDLNGLLELDGPHVGRVPLNLVHEFAESERPSSAAEAPPVAPARATGTSSRSPRSGSPASPTDRSSWSPEGHGDEEPPRTYPPSR
jgi:hypothetical protein